MTTVVQAQQLSLQYPYADPPVLRDLSGTIHQGERILLLGASGSGKSSLCLTLNGLIPHSLEADMRGSLQIFGLDAAHTQPARLARHVGLVFQDPESQFCTLTVEDEIAFGLENLRLPRAEIDRRIGVALDQVGLLDRRTWRLDRLSGGMKQRVMLAATLAMNPQLLILDEATSNLDPAGAAQVVNLVEHLARTQPAQTFLIVEHQLDALIDLVTRVWVLDAAGRLLYDERPRTLFANHGPDLEAAGIWQPLGMSLAHHLRHTGVAFPSYPLNMCEAIAQLRGRPQAWPVATRWAQPGAIAAAHPQPKLVEMHDIHFAYPRSGSVLQNIRLHVRQGEVLALIGANGAGKTTLAQIMVGLLRPTRGTARIRGQDISTVPLRRLAQQCGYVFQNPEHQFVTDRVYDEVAFGLRQTALATEAIDARTEHLLRRLDLWSHRNANPFELSQGQKRRLSVATMLVSDRSLLVLDEPTFGQDVRNRRQLVSILRRLNQEGVTLVLVTHDMDLVWELAHRAAVLAVGRLLGVDRVEKVFSAPGLLDRADLQRPWRAEVASALCQWQAEEVA